MNTLVEVDVVKLELGDVAAYIGKMRAKDILATFDLQAWSEENFDGYQRQLYEERKKQIAEYYRDCPIPIIPAILVTIADEAKFVRNSNDFGTIQLPLRKGAITLIDGQHRVAGFQWFLDQLTKATENERLELPKEEDDSTITLYKKILEFDVPVLFVDANSARAIVEKQKVPQSVKTPTTRRDIERALFLILNKTQKGIRASLKDTLQFLIWRSGIKGIPGLDDESRLLATELSFRLNSSGSPLAGMINASGARGMHRPVQLSSFVSSLDRLYGLPAFSTLTENEKYSFVKSYWTVIKDMYPSAFEADRWREHMVLKTLGVYVLNRIARDCLEWCSSRGIPPTQANISKFLEPLKSIDWYRETSPLKGYQGLDGVNVAYEELKKLLPSFQESQEKIAPKQRAK
jgi:DGQHR domain-containing protein